MSLGEAFDGVTTVGDLRNQLIAKGYAVYAAPSNADVRAYMHPLKLKPVLLVGADVNPCLLYQKRMVDNAIRRS